MKRLKQSELSRQTGIAAFSINNPYLVFSLFVSISIIGIVCALTIPKDLLPAGRDPAVQILSFYSGMPPRNMEQEITFPYERYTGQAVGIKSQDSRSLTGVSIVRNYFHSDVAISSAVAQTGSLVMSVLRKLPPGTEPPLILPFDPMASLPLFIVTVSGVNKTETELQDVARYWVTNAIQSVSGANAPAVMGGKLRQANVLLDNKKLIQFNLSPVRISEKIAEMNSFVPAGNVNLGNYNIQLESDSMFKEISEVNDFYLRSQNGARVKISDVGEAQDGSAIQTNFVTVNGEKQVYIPVYRQLGANSLEVIDQVKASLQALERSLIGYKLKVVSDQTIFIRRAIESISVEGLIGGILAAFMILFFLGSARATVVVLLTIPISIIGAIAVLKFLGHTLNVMTLGGLALSIGVLVDNAIVVIEVIITKQTEGLDPQAAALAGAKEVAMPILASTIATLVVFVPVFFLSGIIETLFSALSISVLAALGISYFAAMMMIPLYCYYNLGRVKSPGGILGWFQFLFKKITRAYGSSLSWALAHSRPILTGSMILHTVIAVTLGFSMGSELFPRADSGSFSINMRGPTGLRIDKTAEIASKIESKVRELIPPRDLKMVILNAGVYYGYSAAFTRNSGSQDASISVELNENRVHTTQYYAKLIRKQFPNYFPNVEFSIELGGLLSSALNRGIASPIDIQVTGLSNSEARTISESLLPKLKIIPGATDVRIQQRFDSPIMELKINRTRVSDLGLTPDLVVKNLVSAVSNSASYNQQVWVNPKTGIDYLLGVQYPENFFRNPEDILQIPITSAAQERGVKLSEIATITTAHGPTELNHVNLSPTSDIFLDGEDRDIGSIAKDVQIVLDQAVLPEGYTAKIQGEVSEMKSSIGLLGGGFLLAAALVYLILVAQFRSFTMPAVIMTNVPKGIVGVIIMLVLTHTPFSIQAAIGCIFVVGVSVSHSVILLEFILVKVKQLPNLENAIIQASMTRLRPITMTSLASIFGLLPMAIGIGQGSEANIPLGRAVIGGQILSTLLNFYLLPCLFHRLASRQLKSHD